MLTTYSLKLIVDGEFQVGKRDDYLHIGHLERATHPVVEGNLITVNFSDSFSIPHPDLDEVYSRLCQNLGVERLEGRAALFLVQKVGLDFDSSYPGDGFIAKPSNEVNKLYVSLVELV